MNYEKENKLLFNLIYRIIYCKIQYFIYQNQLLNVEHGLLRFKNLVLENEDGKKSDEVEETYFLS